MLKRLRARFRPEPAPEDTDNAPRPEDGDQTDVPQDAVDLSGGPTVTDVLP